MRFIGLIAVLVVAASIATASAQTQSRGGHDGKPTSLELTYTKWFAPDYPNMVGRVGGDIVGTFGGAVLERTITFPSAHITAVYVVIAPDPAQSFTAHLEGGYANLATGEAVLDGRVVDGWLKKAKVHVEFKNISCAEAASGMCFQGTISVDRSRKSDD